MSEEVNLIKLKQVGNRIKDIRISLGLTMEEFGELFYTSKGTVNNWEKGRNLPNKENLQLIAYAGKISTAELLYGDKRIYLREFIEKELNSEKFYPWDDYVDKYKDVLIQNTTRSIEKYMEVKNLSYSEIKELVKATIEEQVLAAYKDTTDMLQSLIYEIDMLIVKVEMYTGKNPEFENLKINEIDVETSEEVIEYLKEAKEKISYL